MMSHPLHAGIKMSFLLACLAILPACSSATVESFCTKCSGERENCVEEMSESKSFSEKAGCGDQFQEFLECGESEATCKDGKLDVETACATPYEALTKCGGGID
jgi:hypothetical protein